MNVSPKKPFWHIRRWEWLILIPAATFVILCVVSYFQFLIYVTHHLPVPHRQRPLRAGAETGVSKPLPRKTRD